MFEVEIQILVGGLLLGGIYSLVALGLNLIFGVSGILNLAHGDFLMLGALTSFLLVIFFGMNPFLTLVLVFPLFFLVGAGIFAGVIRPITVKPAEVALLSSIIVTVGLGFMIEDFTAFWTGTMMGINFFSVSYAIPALIIGDTTLPVSPTRLISLICIMFIASGLQIFIKRTATGKIIRAIMQDREGAVMIGANASRITAIVYGIGIFFAAMGGMFYLLITSVIAYAGLPLTIKAFTIIVLGGLGSFPGSVIGAMIIGLVEAFGAFYIGADWAAPLAIVILLVVLVFRPQGLFGRRE